MSTQDPVPVEPDPDAEFDLKKYLPQKWYDLLKGMSSIVLPAVATLVLVVGAQWDWADKDKIAGTVTAVAVFLGLLVRSSASRFKQATNVGDVVVSTTPEGKTLYSMEIGVPFEQIEKLDTMTFGVKR
jgi:hypothetical protein